MGRGPGGTRCGKCWGTEYLLHLSFCWYNQRSEISGPGHQGKSLEQGSVTLGEEGQAREYLRKLDIHRFMGPGGMHSSTEGAG